MKSLKDPRHLKRRQIVKDLFAYSFNPQKVSPETHQVLEHLIEIDKKIEESAPLWPVDKLNKTDLAILRLGVYEMLFEKTPSKVIIDEAVELAKEFGTETAPSFVNGVLGNLLTNDQKS